VFNLLVIVSKLAADRHVCNSLASLGLLLFGGCGHGHLPSPYAEYEKKNPKTEIELPCILSTSTGFSSDSTQIETAARVGMATQFQLSFRADVATDVPGVILLSWRKHAGHYGVPGAVVNEATSLVERRSDGTGFEAVCHFSKTPVPGKYEIEVRDGLSSDGRAVRFHLVVDR
jgi:hypothetical protein